MMRRHLRGVWWCVFWCGVVGVLWSCEGGGGEVVLDAVRPNRGFRRSSTSVAILGRGLPKGGSFELANQKSRVVLTGLEWKSATEIGGTVPAGVAVGRYDLVYKGSAGEPVILGGAFEVLPDALTIYGVKVGQGDSTLIISPTGKTMLIDAGREDGVVHVQDLLRQLGIQKLDHVMATHYDADHVGGFESLFKGRDRQANTADDVVPTEAIWDHGGWSKSSSYSAARARFSSIYKVLDGKTDASFPTISLGGGVEVEVRVTNGVFKKADGSRFAVACGSDSNCLSVGVMVKYGKFRMWTAGDLTGGGNGTPDVESVLAPELSKVDIYRAHHHGSKTSSNTALMRVLQPQVVLVSAGLDNSYCHPHVEVLERYLQIPKIWVLVTSEGISRSGSCGVTTRERLKGIGNRGIVGAGNIRVVAEVDKFALFLEGHPDAYSFEVKR